MALLFKKDGQMNKKRLFAGFVAVFVGVLFLSLGNAFGEEAKRLLSIEAYDMLNSVPDTYLIDVRTRGEYQFVGHPVNAYLFPYMFMTKKFTKNGEKCGYLFNVKNKEFIAEINKVFKKTDKLLIISRDGVRSALAAKDLVHAGFKAVYDVEDGFEGPQFPSCEISLILKDSDKHKYYRQLAKKNKIHGFDKRRHYGWQSWGLPWTYEMDPKFVYPSDLRPSKK